MTLAATDMRLLAHRMPRSSISAGEACRHHDSGLLTCEEGNRICSVKRAGEIRTSIA